MQSFNTTILHMTVIDYGIKDYYTWIDHSFKISNNTSHFYKFYRKNKLLNKINSLKKYRTCISNIIFEKSL